MTHGVLHERFDAVAAQIAAERTSFRNFRGGDVRVRFDRLDQVADLLEMIGIQIFLTPGANAVGVADAVAKTMRGLAERFPPGLVYAVNYDTTTFVKLTIEVVIDTLIEAFILVVLVVFLFLGSVRATIIPLVAVPVSRIATFAVLNAMG